MDTEGDILNVMWPLRHPVYIYTKDNTLNIMWRLRHPVYIFI